MHLQVCTELAEYVSCMEYASKRICKLRAVDREHCKSDQSFERGREEMDGLQSVVIKVSPEALAGKAGGCTESESALLKNGFDRIESSVKTFLGLLVRGRREKLTARFIRTAGQRLKRLWVGFGRRQRFSKRSLRIIYQMRHRRKARQTGLPTDVIV